MELETETKITLIISIIIISILIVGLVCLYNNNEEVTQQKILNKINLYYDVCEKDGLTSGKIIDNKIICYTKSPYTERKKGIK